MWHSREAKKTGLALYDDNTPFGYFHNIPDFELPPPPEQTLLRGVRIWGNYYRHTDAPLKQVLETADKMFENIAQHTGSQVVPHVWGLRSCRSRKNSQPAPEVEDTAISRHYIPRGYNLVAEVSIIDDAQPLMPYASDRIGRGLNEHYNDEAAPAYWWDGDVRQFSTGIDRQSRTAATWLIDIEPLLSVNKDQVTDHLSTTRY